MWCYVDLRSTRFWILAWDACGWLFEGGEWSRQRRVSGLGVVMISEIAKLIYDPQFGGKPGQSSVSVMAEGEFQKCHLITCRWRAWNSTWRMQEDGACVDCVRRIRDHTCGKKHSGSVLQDDRWTWPEDKDHNQGTAAERVSARHYLQPWIWTGRRPRCGRYPTETEIQACVDWPLFTVRLRRWLDRCHSSIFVRDGVKVISCSMCSLSSCN